MLCLGRPVPLARARDLHLPSDECSRRCASATCRRGPHAQPDRSHLKRAEHEHRHQRRHRNAVTSAHLALFPHHFPRSAELPVLRLRDRRHDISPSVQRYPQGCGACQQEIAGRHAECHPPAPIRPAPLVRACIETSRQRRGQGTYCFAEQPLGSSFPSVAWRLASATRSAPP